MAEICFNLWYYLNRDQSIVAISARRYVLGGTDQEKAVILKALSYNDYKLIPSKPLPRDLLDRFGGRIHYSVLSDLGVEEVYREIFSELGKQNPPGIPFPENKFFYATPLVDHGNGYVPAEIGNGFIKNE